MQTKEQITMHFGGGSLYLKCHACGKHVGAEDVGFPGSPEQQKESRAKLEIKKQVHLKICKQKN